MGDGRNRSTDMQDPLEAQIIALLEKEEGYPQAFQLMVKAYSRKLYWLVRRLVEDHDDSNDIVQNVFLKVWENLHRFRGEARVYTWIYRIASNEALNFLRRQSRRPQVSLDDHEEALATTSAGYDGPEGERIQERLNAAVRALPEKQRLVFTLKYYEEMKYEDMAAVTGTSVGALKASYHHAVKKIEEFLNED